MMPRSFAIYLSSWLKFWNNVETKSTCFFCSIEYAVSWKLIVLYQCQPHPMNEIEMVDIILLLFGRYASSFTKTLHLGSLFFCEAYVSFSGQQAYNDWFLSLYNVFFNSLPVIALGVFDQDVSARFCLKICLMFQCIFVCLTCDAWWLKSREFGYGVLSDWNLTVHGFREGGEVVIGLEILGATLYTCIVLVVNCQMALSINYFTSIQHLFIWGGIVFWFIFLMVYGAILDPYLSTTAYKVFIEAPLCTSPVLLANLTACVVIYHRSSPILLTRPYKCGFSPCIIRWYTDGHTEDPDYCIIWYGKGHCGQQL